MKKTTSEASKRDRNTVEKNRRIEMKGLCFKLASLIPPDFIKPSKTVVATDPKAFFPTRRKKLQGVLTQLDQLDYATSYIKQLKERVEELNDRKEQIIGLGTSSNEIDKTMIDSKLPLIDLKESGSTIEVTLITGLQKYFVLSEVAIILQEEGAEVVSASFSTVGDKVFHTIHAQVKIPRVGVETARVRQRLQDLVF